MDGWTDHGQKIARKLANDGGYLKHMQMISSNSEQLTNKASQPELTLCFVYLSLVTVDLGGTKEEGKLKEMM